MSAQVIATSSSVAKSCNDSQSNVPTQEASSPTADLSRTRWASLGALRFFLAVCVIFTHLGEFFDPATYFGGSFFASLSGYAAVIGFFVVSGYSINASVERDGAGFARRRFTRIYPIYFAANILGLFLYGVHAGPAPIPIADAPNLITFHPPIANHVLRTLATMGFGFACLPFIITVPLPYMNPAWSLTCEVLYYTMAKWLKRIGTRAVMSLAAASLLAYIAHNIFVPNQYYSLAYYLVAPVCLFWAWGIGFAYNQSPRTMNTRLLLVSAIAILTMLPALERTPHMLFTCLIAGVGIVLAELVVLKQRTAKVFTYLGEISYPLYLVHTPAFLLIYHFVDRGLHLPPVVYIAGAIGLASAFYHFVDLPARRFAAARFNTKLADGDLK